MNLQPEKLRSRSASTLQEDVPQRMFPPIPAEDRPVFREDASAAGSERAIVLIPSTHIDSERLQQALHRLGLSPAAEITLLGSSNRQDSQGSSKLYRLAFLLRAGGAVVTCQALRPGESWISAVRRVSRTGDLIIFHAEYQGQKLSEALALEPGRSVYVLSGVYPTVPRRAARLIGRAIFEVLPLVIIVGTFWLQIQISEQTTGVVNTVALVLSVLFELGLILIWSFFIS